MFRLPGLLVKGFRVDAAWIPVPGAWKLLQAWGLRVNAGALIVRMGYRGHFYFY